MNLLRMYVLSRTVSRTSRACQDTFGKCLDHAPLAKSLLSQKRYCEVMSVSNVQENTRRCLTSFPRFSQCLGGEFEDMRQAACGAESISHRSTTVGGHLARWRLVIAWIVVLASSNFV